MIIFFVLRIKKMVENNTIYTSIINATGQIAILIDPEKTNKEVQLELLITRVEKSDVKFLFVGGSSAKKKQVEFVVQFLKNNCALPVILFPGSNQQFSNYADGILYLSLLTSSNSKFLIDQHAENSIAIYHSNVEILPTAYLLIDGESDSSVAKISASIPLTRKAKKEALKISLAGLLQGKKIIFLDAGSGAKKTVPISIIKEIKKHTNAPIIIGGGVKTTKKLILLNKIGVNIIVVGNHIEKNIANFKFISDYLSIKKKV
jgi:phosphoglycerol geranylgeranyltransferase